MWGQLIMGWCLHWMQGQAVMGRFDPRQAWCFSNGFERRYQFRIEWKWSVRGRRVIQSIEGDGGVILSSQILHEIKGCDKVIYASMVAQSYTSSIIHILHENITQLSTKRKLHLLGPKRCWLWIRKKRLKKEIKISTHDITLTKSWFWCMKFSL